MYKNRGVAIKVTCFISRTASDMPGLQMCELIELSKETIASCEPMLETIITHRVQGHPHVRSLLVIETC